MSTLLVNGCELGLFCPSLLHQRKDDDDCIRLRLVVLLCGKTRGDDIHNHTDHPRSLHFTTTTTITRSLTVYTLLSPPIPHHSSTVRARHGDTAPGARFCLLRRPIDRERDAYSTLLLQHSTTALQYNRTVLFIETSLSLFRNTPLARWLAPQSQARHGQHHPPLSQHAIRGRTNTPNRLQALRHMSRRDSYLPAM
jgi:hypothetical protein